MAIPHTTYFLFSLASSSVMDSSSSSDYVIYHPDKLRFSDIFNSLVFGTSLAGSEFIETNLDATKLASLGATNPIKVLTCILQKILLFLSGPMEILGNIVEYTLNFLHNLVTGKMELPDKYSADYRSLIGYIDGRKDLMEVSSILNNFPSINPLSTTATANKINPMDLAIMAAKVVYENKAYIESVVTNHWKMYFVGLFNFWNDYLQTEDTQAFVCCDREVDAQVILVAFRGTEPFNARDWVTDVDLSWLSMGEMGCVHVGFMCALGLQDRNDYKKGWPKDYQGTKNLAYYSLKNMLQALLKRHSNAKIIVAGHSLGGALAVLFPSILVLHQENEILSKLAGVYTFGQPRVGNKAFCDHMNPQLNVVFKRYFRVVYRYDIVPRVPFEDSFFQFAHFGGCLYYKNWYKGKVMKNEPNKNYFGIRYIPSLYLNALLDLLRGLFAGFWPGGDYRESLVSILFRLVGLLFPGAASHSPRDYVNGVRLGTVLMKHEDDEDETAGF